MNASDRQEYLNGIYQGKYLLKNGKYIGICKVVRVIAPPSGWNARYEFELHSGEKHTSNTYSEFRAVTAAELLKVKRGGEEGNQ